MDSSNAVPFLSGKRANVILTAFLLLMGFGPSIAAAAITEELANTINCVLCRVAGMLFMLVAGLAALVIILAGIQWLTSGDDPGARAKAKSTIINVFVGVIIIFVAVYAVSWVLSGKIPGGMDITQWLNTNGCSTISGCS